MPNHCAHVMEYWEEMHKFNMEFLPYNNFALSAYAESYNKRLESTLDFCESRYEYYFKASMPLDIEEYR